MYLHHDTSKLKSRDRYIVTATDNEWVYVRKFTGNQLRNASYKVKRSECFKVPTSLLASTTPPTSPTNDYEDIEDITFASVDESPYNAHDTSEIPCEQEIPTDASIPLHEDESAVPNVIVPQEIEVDELVQNTSSRPQRSRRPVEKLNISWNSKTYT